MGHLGQRSWLEKNIKNLIFSLPVSQISTEESYWEDFGNILHVGKEGNIGEYVIKFWTTQVKGQGKKNTSNIFKIPSSNMDCIYLNFRNL